MGAANFQSLAGQRLKLSNETTATHIPYMCIGIWGKNSENSRALDSKDCGEQLIVCKAVRTQAQGYQSSINCVWLFLVRITLGTVFIKSTSSYYTRI